MKHKKRAWCTCTALLALILNKNVAFPVPLFSTNPYWCSKTAACTLDLILNIMILNRILMIWLIKRMILTLPHSTPDAFRSATEIDFDISRGISLCCKFHSIFHTRHRFQLHRELLIHSVEFGSGPTALPFFILKTAFLSSLFNIVGRVKSSSKLKGWEPRIGFP